jgi:chromosome segregation ATPase
VVEVAGEKKYFRPLQDYAAAFLELRKRMAELLDDLVASKADLDQMNKAVKAAESQLMLRDAELAALKTELETSNRERELVGAQESALDMRVKAIQAEAAQLMAENKKLAAQWSATQLEAAKKMEQLSRAPQTRGVQ